MSSDFTFQELIAARANIIRQGSTYWGGGEASPPPKSFTEKKFTVISNTDLF